MRDLTAKAIATDCTPDGLRRTLQRPPWSGVEAVIGFLALETDGWVCGWVDVDMRADPNASP
jgi:hypothetical protein